MEKQQITFDTLPEAIGRVLKAVENIERRLAEERRDMTEEQSELLNTSEAADLLKIAKQTLYAKVMRREIPHIKQGKMLLFQRTELFQYLHNGKRATAKESEQQKEKESEERFAKSIGGKRKR